MMASLGMLPPGTLVRQTVASPVDVTVRIFSEVLGGAVNQ